MYDALFENQRWLEDADLLGYAADVGLDVDRFEQEAMAHVHAGRVHEDVAAGRESRVQGTPTFFLNGVQLGSPTDSEALLAAISEALGRSS